MKNNNKNFIHFIWLFIFLFVLFAINFALIKEKSRGTTRGAHTKKINNQKTDKNKKQYYSELRVVENEKKSEKQTPQKLPIFSRRKNEQKEMDRKNEKIEIKPAIVIIIDDFGYNYKIAEEFAKLDMPITFSILPNLAYSNKIAALANSSGKQVMLHLPMEPYSSGRIEKSMIMSDMTREEIEKKINEDIITVPFVVGVNNHEGSKATENYSVMTAVLEECKKRHMFYLDSITTYSSQAESAARKLNMKINRRDIFLDNEDNIDYIFGNLEKLKKIAEKNDFAIGIGHARINTAEALKKFYNENKDKIDFIFAEEIYK